MSVRGKPGWLRRAGGWLARRLGLRRAASREPRRATLDQPTIDLTTSRAKRPAAPRGAPSRRATSGAPLGRSPGAAARMTAAAAAPTAAAPMLLREPPIDGLSSVEARVEGALIHAVERPARPGADPDAAAVILVHGAGLDHRDWTYAFIDDLPADRRVLAFDRPGFGRSERPRGAASALPATQARLLRGAALALGVRQAVLVGHSWGGAVVMAWALDAPERVCGVASLAGAVAPWSLATAVENGRRMHDAAVRALGSGGLREASIEALRESFAPDPIPDGYVDHVRTELNPLTGPAAATIADVSTINGALALMAPRYTSLLTPVELVYGEEDRILPAAEQIAIAPRLARAHVTLLPGVGHMLHHTARAASLAAIDRLLAPA